MIIFFIIIIINLTVISNLMTGWLFSSKQLRKYWVTNTVTVHVICQIDYLKDDNSSGGYSTLSGTNPQISPPKFANSGKPGVSKFFQ